MYELYVYHFTTYFIHVIISFNYGDKKDRFYAFNHSFKNSIFKYTMSDLSFPYCCVLGSLQLFPIISHLSNTFLSISTCKTA